MTRVSKPAVHGVAVQHFAIGLGYRLDTVRPKYSVQM